MGKRNMSAYDLEYVTQHLNIKEFMSERDMYPFLKKKYALLKMYLIQKRGLPDFLMIGINYIENGWMECKCVKTKIENFSVESELSRPQQIFLDILIRSGYKYYIAVCEKGRRSIFIYEVKLRTEELDEHRDQLLTQQETIGSLI